MCKGGGFKIPAPAYSFMSEPSNFIKRLQLRAETCHEQLRSMRDSITDFIAYLHTPKFAGVASDGSRKDWIATGDVLRWLMDVRSQSLTGNPVRVRRLGSGRYRVSTPRRVHAFSTSRAKAMRQAGLLRRVHKNPAAESPFREELRRNIAKTIARLKKEGTVSMGINNLIQVTPTPRALDGAPRGYSSLETQMIYREMFRDIATSTPAFRRFLLPDRPAHNPTRRRRRGAIPRIFARRSGQRWTISTARRGGLILAKGLTRSALAAWGRSHGYQLK